MNAKHHCSAAKRRRRTALPSSAAERQSSMLREILQARALLRENKLEQTEAVCKRVLGTAPGNGAVLDLLGAIAYRRGAFEAHGLTLDRYCALSNRLETPQFAAAMRVADVFLDSVGWSGCNTTLEAFAEGLPAVTCRGATMRGCHTAAMLEMIGLHQCIADTVDDYIALAVRMGTDADWRQEMAKQVVARKHQAFDDPACIKGLEAFLLAVVEIATLPVAADQPARARGNGCDRGGMKPALRRRL